MWVGKKSEREREREREREERERFLSAMVAGLIPEP